MGSASPLACCTPHDSFRVSNRGNAERMLRRHRARADMSATRKQKVVYWVVTALFLLPMAGSGVPELLFEQPASTVATLVHLGYPLYLMRILGLAKVLGAMAIVSGRSRTLKEWAY